MATHWLASREIPRTAKSISAGLANLLCLAASPSFALMALLSAMGGNADPICAASGPGFHAGSMGAMYLMMSAFHLPPWLRKLRQR
jgi:hypothetical protein